MRENLVSKLLFIMGIALMVAGLLTGVIIGAFGYRYGLNLANGMMWSVLFTYFFAGIVLGLLFIGLSEVVKLLHNLNGKLSLLENRPEDASAYHDVRTEQESSGVHHQAEADMQTNQPEMDVQPFEAERTNETIVQPNQETEFPTSHSSQSAEPQENGVSGDQIETAPASNTDHQEDAAVNESQENNEFVLTEADKARIMDYYEDKEILEIIPSNQKGYGLVKMMGTDGRAFVQIVDIRGSSIAEVHNPELKQQIISWYNRRKGE